MAFDAHVKISSTRYNLGLLEVSILSITYDYGISTFFHTIGRRVEYGPCVAGETFKVGWAKAFLASCGTYLALICRRVVVHST
jgi:hypothetical protein